MQEEFSAPLICLKVLDINFVKVLSLYNEEEILVTGFGESVLG